MRLTPVMVRAGELRGEASWREGCRLRSRCGGRSGTGSAQGTVLPSETGRRVQLGHTDMETQGLTPALCEVLVADARVRDGLQVWEEELLAHEMCEEVRRQGAAAMRVCTPRPAPAHMGAVSTSIPMLE